MLDNSLLIGIGQHKILEKKLRGEASACVCVCHLVACSRFGPAAYSHLLLYIIFPFFGPVHPTLPQSIFLGPQIYSF